jgi:hypothetical protein
MENSARNRRQVSNFLGSVGSNLFRLAQASMRVTDEVFHAGFGLFVCPGPPTRARWRKPHRWFRINIQDMSLTSCSHVDENPAGD